MEIYVLLLIFLNIISVYSQNTGNKNIVDVTSRQGKDNTNLKIIGGLDAPPHSFPYQVGIYVRKTTRVDFCGGSLISPNYVLTAAHCVENTISMDLIFGAEDVTKNETSQVRQTSTSFISHPQWNVPVFANDIALVKLNPPVYETDYIKFINISSIKSNWTGETGVIAGWGSTSNDQEKVTPKLRYVNSTIMSNDECKNYDSEYKSILQPSMLCFAGTGIVGSCGGDSGGPLGVRGEQIGIISFGKADCTKGDPSVLTRLSEYISWLKDNSDINI